MTKSRNECQACVVQNLDAIREHLVKLSDEKTNILFYELKDVLHFYGFKESEIKNNIYFPGDFDDLSDERMVELEGVTNAILFHLKYKM